MMTMMTIAYLERLRHDVHGLRHGLLALLVGQRVVWAAHAAHVPVEAHLLLAQALSQHLHSPELPSRHLPHQPVRLLAQPSPPVLLRPEHYLPQPVLVDVLEALHHVPVLQHQVHLDPDPLLRHLVPKRLLHLLSPQRFGNLRYHLILEAGTEPERPHDPQRVVHESLKWVQRSPDDARLEIADSQTRVIFDGLLVDIVEEGVDGEIPPESIL